MHSIGDTMRKPFLCLYRAFIAPPCGWRRVHRSTKEEEAPPLAARAP